MTRYRCPDETPTAEEMAEMTIDTDAIQRELDAERAAVAAQVADTLRAGAEDLARYRQAIAAGRQPF